MSEPAAIELYAGHVEIIPPKRSGQNSWRCECCSESKPCDAFEEDGFGICTDCLADDALALSWDVASPPAGKHGQRVT